MINKLVSKEYNPGGRKNAYNFFRFLNTSDKLIRLDPANNNINLTYPKAFGDKEISYKS